MNPYTADGMGIDGLTVDSLTAHIVRWAAYRKRESVAALARYRDFVANDDYVSASGWHKRYLDQSIAVSAIVHPLRMAIEERTREETVRAIVSKDRAYFTDTACAGETCDDCDMPLWMHIQVRKSAGIPNNAYPVQLCPFGREYWTIARLIVRDAYDVIPGLHRTVLPVIARMTRGHGAPVWKPALEPLPF